MNRKTHNFLNKFSAEIIKIQLSLNKMKTIVDNYVYIPKRRKKWKK